MSGKGWARRVAEACEWIAARCSLRPQTAIVLGSGLDKLAGAVQVEASFSFADIPHLPRSTALGHTGELVLGRLAERPVVVMRGRSHLYEGHSSEEVTLPIGLMQALGAQRLVLSNASGGLNPFYRAGDIMVIDDHIDLMHVSLPMLESTEVPPRDKVYDRAMVRRAVAVARRHDFPIHVGVYAGFKGPNYETRAEYRLLRNIGADAVGMSTVPEAVVARYLGMRVVGLSTIANVAFPDALKETTGEEVVAVVQTAEPRLRTLVENLVAGG